MVIDGDYPYRDEYWVTYVIDELIFCTPMTNITSYVNYTSIKKLEDMNSHFTEEDMQVANKYMKRYPTWLAQHHYEENAEWLKLKKSKN